MSYVGKRADLISFMTALVLGAVVAFFFSVTAQAQDTQTMRLSFAAGKSSKTVRGSIQGYDAVEYRVKATAGQTLSVSMKTTNLSSYFNVTAEGAQQALHIGSSDGNRMQMTVPSSGDYSILVYLMRNAARRGEVANYSLTVTITGSAAYDDGSGVGADFADGLMGGPDFWRVSNVPPGDKLNVRTIPSARGAIVMRANNGLVLRNLGCRIASGQRWCKVELPNGTRRGWAAGRFLRE